MKRIVMMVAVLAALIAAGVVINCTSPSASPDLTPQENTTGPMVGQVIVDPDNPAHLVRYAADGKHQPFYMCGPGDPEDFLFRNDQEDILAAMEGTGANCLYFQAVRSHGGDGGPDHNPFIDNDPAKGVDNAVLDKWDKWFDRMDELGIVALFFVYDDSSAPFARGDDMPDGEREFVEALVKKFSHHKNLIWCVAEEYGEKLTTKRASNIAAEIARLDPRGHVVAVHQNNNLAFEFATDPNVSQFAMQWNDRTGDALHTDMVKAWSLAAGRYNVNQSENTVTVVQIRTNDRAGLRKDGWACAMAGAHYMWLGSWTKKSGAPSREMLEDAGRLVKFMESTKYNRMAPKDELALGDTQYVLAAPNDSYIAYSSACTSGLGLKNLTPGEYSLRWLDCVTGIETKQVVKVTAVDQTWPMPDGTGPELALHVKLQK